MYVRISRGHFDGAQLSTVEAMLRAAEADLIPAIRRLPGVQSYYAGIDGPSGSMVNVSVWDTLEAAQQMATLKEMADLRVHFEAAGIRFEPVVNYDVVWQL